MLFKKNPDMEYIETDETGLVIFDPVSGNTCIIDEIGVALFKAMGDGATLDAIVDTLLQEYDAPREEILHDVEDFLNQLIQQGIIVSCE